MPVLVKKWDFATDIEGWNTGLGGGNPSWEPDAGEGDGGLYASCNSLGTGCEWAAIPGSDSNQGVGFNYQGTWESIGIPANSLITGLLQSSDGDFTKVRAQWDGPSGTTNLRNYYVYDSADSSIWLAYTTHNVANTWTDELANQGDSGALSIASSENFRLTIGHTGSVANKALGRRELFIDEVQLVVQYESLEDPGVYPFWYFTS